MTAPRSPKVAGIQPAFSPPSQTPPSESRAASSSDTAEPADVSERLSDLTALHELTAELARTESLDSALRETLRAGAALLGARRGLIALEPGAAPGTAPERTIGLGLGRADLGQIETVPRASAAYARILDGTADTAPVTSTSQAQAQAQGQAPSSSPSPGGHARAVEPEEQAAEHPHPEPASGEEARAAPSLAGIAYPDIATDEALDPLHREVAARIGFAASYAVPLDTRDGTRLGAAVWLYDDPAEPTARQRHLLCQYLRYATEHAARIGELARARAEMTELREELLPPALPRVPGVRLAARHRTGPRGGGDWYDALPLPDGALGLAVGGVTGSGPTAVAAMGRLRASLRAYAVMEGEDPVAVLSDLELLLRLTEPARSATALFAYAEPASRRVLIAGAGHCPPLVVGPERVEPVETTLSAPLGMLACWEAPSVEVTLREGETLLFYSDGLLHRTGDPMDRAFARLHGAAAGAPPAAREDPDALVEHVLRTLLPGPLADQTDHPEDVVLLAARF
ncbi:PP2C family protein-serine/threonine phosphatase [Streptomyces sp. NPDC048172]|uniref:PP2C family protein-serine/threonine phosphatase n=1 Tax=Streptomyces sp. NPDC048172 TaxID=3365505 RepID=UPI00371AEB90